jgi:hypothetical protein
VFPVRTLIYQQVIRCLIATICCTILVFELYGQESYQISGYIIDQETGDPVPYASIGVPEQHRGISANINGYFLLILPVNNPEHHLRISSIGYQTRAFSLSEVRWGGTDQNFNLIPETQLLEEVVILGKKRTVEDLVKATSKNRKVYLRSTPYLMNGFYREILSINQRYRGFTEAQGILYLQGYDPGYKNNDRHLTYDLMQWKHMRRSDYPQNMEQYLKITNLLKAKDYYLHYGPLRNKNLNKFAYSITDSTSYQDRLVLEISFEAKDEFESEFSYRGKMYVKEDDQALLGLEVLSTGPLPFLKQNDPSTGNSSEFKISFIQFDGQYYLGNTSLSQTYSLDDEQYRWDIELFGATFVDQKAMFLNYNQKVVLYSEMLNPLVNYNAEFWHGFSFADSDQFNEFAAETDLNAQFEAHHQQRLVPLPDGFDNYEQMSNDRDALEMIMQR